MNPQLAIPLFPLNTVLFPGGPLKLRIFETRYVDMIGRCMRSDAEFGVAMIVEGMEIGAARTASIGTTARIFDFEQLKDGLLGIAARGCRRFRIGSVEVQPDGLNVASVEVLAPDPASKVDADFHQLVEMVRLAYPHVRAHYADPEPLLTDASWLSARATELLPLGLQNRQECLELDDPIERLHYLKKYLDELGLKSGS